MLQNLLLTAGPIVTIVNCVLLVVLLGKVKSVNDSVGVVLTRLNDLRKTK